MEKLCMTKHSELAEQFAEAYDEVQSSIDSGRPNKYSKDQADSLEIDISRLEFGTTDEAASKVRTNSSLLTYYTKWKLQRLVHETAKAYLFAGRNNYNCWIPKAMTSNLVITTDHKVEVYVHNNFTITWIRQDGSKVQFGTGGMPHEC